MSRVKTSAYALTFSIFTATVLTVYISNVLVVYEKESRIKKLLKERSELKKQDL